MTYSIFEMFCARLYRSWIRYSPDEPFAESLSFHRGEIKSMRRIYKTKQAANDALESYQKRFPERILFVAANE